MKHSVNIIDVGSSLGYFLQKEVNNMKNILPEFLEQEC